ncbi:hypothetical protein L1987_18489 [Smallanthus sonchifolius]|uniref:Uncharacterized protein n=1 Tax=Smallanthus sonchifolius TaxID=185202 RepID=A0ACB9J071_9ASTR|nr:hypothetical protein L1987_18489 [Smallanthus sonchifolius]
MNLRIRSGGHDFEGLSYVSHITYVLLDMSNLRSIDVNIEEETATVQVGDSERLVSVMNSGFPELDIQKPDCKEMSWIKSVLFWWSNYSVNWDEEGEEAAAYYVNQARVLHEFMTRFVSKNPREAFQNYRDLDIGTSVVGNNSYTDGKFYGEKYFKRNFDRLVKVKTTVDRDNFFTNEQSIPPLRTRKNNMRK